MHADLGPVEVDSLVVISPKQENPQWGLGAWLF